MAIIRAYERWLELLDQLRKELANGYIVTPSLQKEGWVTCHPGGEK
jgi:hypothetical protein